VVVKTEPKSESSPPKRKSKTVDSDDDDVPLVCQIFNFVYLKIFPIISRQKKLKINQQKNPIQQHRLLLKKKNHLHYRHRRKNPRQLLNKKK
jgi:hypothetical protein